MSLNFKGSQISFLTRSCWAHCGSHRRWLWKGGSRAGGFDANALRAAVPWLSDLPWGQALCLTALHSPLPSLSGFPAVAAWGAAPSGIAQLRSAYGIRAAGGDIGLYMSRRLWRWQELDVRLFQHSTACQQDICGDGNPCPIRGRMEGGSYVQSADEAYL